MAGMDIGKKMMEKWGWSKGQGLGRDNKGMTSCLILRKNDGSANQGRIELSDKPMFSKTPQPPDTGDPALLRAFYASVGVVPPDPESNPLAGDNGAVTHNAGMEDLDGLIAKYGSGSTLGSGAENINYGAPRVVSSTGESWPQPVKRTKRQYTWARLYDDWRWSKGTEALRVFEEMQLPPMLRELAQKVMGENSRYPARIADDTDCVVSLTAWDTIILRPRGTGADMNLAKRMLFQVMHPSQKGLREDVIFEEDELAEAAINDASLILEGMQDAGDGRLKNMIDRRKTAKLGIGADLSAQFEAALPSRMEKRELALATMDDVKLVKAHLKDVKLAVGVQACVSGATLILSGKEAAVDRAQHLLTTLMETGEWVALTETFIVSEETTKKAAKPDDGPVEQILIKVPEGRATQMIGTHLKAIEKAAGAETLKLSSKPIAGRRTLMVEGTRKAHERVKLMAKELAEKGSSPMLTKHLASAGTAAAAPISTGKATAPGVISAAPALVTDILKVEKEEPVIKIEDNKVIKQEPGAEIQINISGVIKVEDEAGTKVEKVEKVEVVKEEPKAEMQSGQSGVIDISMTDDSGKGSSAAPAFPPSMPLPPGPTMPLPDLFAGLPPEVSVSGATGPPAKKQKTDAAEQELLEFIGGVTE